MILSLEKERHSAVNSPFLWRRFFSIFFLLFFCGEIDSDKSVAVKREQKEGRSDAAGVDIEVSGVKMKLQCLCSGWPT